MIIVIDAYNVLKQVLGTTRVAESYKNQFINQLSKYSSQKGHTIVLVFDAGPFEWPSKERVSGIYVVHSGVNENADTWIKDYVSRHKSHDVLLVSTDRELGRFVSRLNVQTMDALDFYAILQEALKVFDSSGSEQKQTVVKISDLEQPELDSLMLDASKVVPQKAEDMSKDRASKAHRHSKKERKIVQKIKKL